MEQSRSDLHSAVRPILRLVVLLAGMAGIATAASGQSRLMLPDFSDLFLPEFSHQDARTMREGLDIRDDQVAVFDTLLTDYMTGFSSSMLEARQRITALYPLQEDVDAEAEKIASATRQELQAAIEAFKIAQENGDPNAIEAAKATLEAIQQRFREQREQVRPAPMPTQDVRAIGDAVLEALASWREHRAELREEFVAGLLVVLDQEQQRRWPAVERRLRRASERDDARLSGEGLDLVALLEDSTADESLEAVWTTLDSYSIELDDLLQEKREHIELSRFELYRAAMAGDPSRALAVVDRELDLRTRIRDLNLRMADAIARLLPDTAATTFLGDVRLDGFPRIFRPTTANRRILGSSGEPGLAAAKRAEHAALLAEYRDRYESITLEIYRETVAHEPALERQRMLHRFGIRINEPQSVTEPIQDAYQKRTELDRDTQTAVETLIGL